MEDDTEDVDTDDFADGYDPNEDLWGTEGEVYDDYDVD